MSSSRLIRIAYDVTAPLYPLSSRYFHRNAHFRLLERAGDLDGLRVLEIATGSGEMFRMLAAANPTGMTAGADLSPGMVAAVRRAVAGHAVAGHAVDPAAAGKRREYPLQACDARALPFRDAAFDVVVCCYLFELLPEDAMDSTAVELARVLRGGGRLLLTNVSQNFQGFNLLYRAGAAAIPMFFGRQVAAAMPGVLARAGFRVVSRETVRQNGYPTDVTVALALR